MSEARRLRVLDERRAELETCAYCPKLCRAACPVSDAEASESVTPWGKMSSLFEVARGTLESHPEEAALSWACSGCMACRERCDHRNPVRETLYAGRAHYLAAGHAPPAVTHYRERFAARLERVRACILELRARHGHSASAPTAVVVGCEYALRLERVVDDGLIAARALFGPLRVLSGCCGLGLEAAGDLANAALVRASLLRKARGAARVIAFDAGCAFALREAGVVPFVRAAEQALKGHQRRSKDPRLVGLRYHDPCLLGRGLGEYRAPRALIERAAGEPPREFFRRESAAACAGGGGLLPLTRPESSARIAALRVAEHRELGGGVIATACAASHRNLQRAGAEVMDLLTIVRLLAEP